MATIDVKDAAGATVALEKPLAAGQAAMAASRPVVIASNQTVIPVSDNAGSLTVDNGGTFAVQATEADGANVTLGAKTDAKSTATDATSITAMQVWKQISASIQALVTAFGSAWTRGAGASDANTQRVTIDSGQVGSLGSAVSASSAPVVIASDQGWPVSTTGFMKKEDVASADGDAGIPAMVVRKATPANTSGTDGDFEFLQASAGSLWTASVATDKTLVSERVINGGSQYETVAASQTNQAMGATGAAGDYLSHVIVSPGTAGCGVVTILDNATAVVSFPGGGTTALSNLIPFVIPIGIVSTSGAWKITTGANVTAVGVGRFT